jgi:hypothetical protein
MAVYLATSDEAIPIILAQPDKAKILLPLILTKIFIALVAGYSLDLIFRKSNKKIIEHTRIYSCGQDNSDHHHESIIEERACCGHSPSCSAKKFSPKEIIFHPLIHTLKIFTFILIISILINLAVWKIGEESLQNLLSGHIFLQPFIAALIGLIPNCASSVALTELYLKGIITYGSVIAGLCASGGLGILVLFKEEKNRKNVFLIIGLLFIISVISGLIIQYFV